MTTFEDAMTNYLGARQGWYLNRAAAIACKEELGEMRQQLKEAEAEIVVNNGTEDCPIDGKNAEMRTAQLIHCIAQNKAYGELEGATARKESALARLELAAEDAANHMRLARYQMEYAIAEKQQEAAMLGGPERWAAVGG